MSHRTRFLFVVGMLSGLALLLASGTLYLHQSVSSRQTAIRNFSLTSAMIAENSIAALSRQSARQAVQILNVLASDPNIVEGCLFTSTGRVLGTYLRKDQEEDFEPPEIKKDGQYTERGKVQIFHSVVMNDAKIGTLYLRADLESNLTAGVLAVTISVVGLVFAVFLATKLFPYVIGQPEEDTLGESVPESQDSKDSILNLYSPDLSAVESSVAPTSPETRPSPEQVWSLSSDYVDSVVGSMIDTMLVIDPSGVVNRVNKAALSLLGYSEEELIGGPLGKLLEDEEQFYMLQGLIETGSVQEFELTYVTKHGRKIPMQCSGSVVRDRRGEIQGIVCIAKDITEQKLAQEALRESEERFRSLFQNVPIGVYRITPDGTVVNVNPAFLRMLGFYSLEEILEREAEGDMPYFSKGMRERLEREEEVRGLELAWKKRDGAQIFVRVNARAIRNSEGSTLCFEGTVEDITDRKRIEQMRNEFISMVSHELRVPLASIHGSLEWMAEKLGAELPDRARRMIEIASRSSDRMVRLINDLLDIERIESGKIVFDMKVMDLCALVEHAIEANQPYAQQFEVHLEFASARREAMVKVDADRLMQVMTNLLSNASKFSAEGGKVEVSVFPVDEFIRTEVRDFGSGIPEAFRPRIFQKFAQVRSANGKTKGSGLGLSISKAIIKKLGGQIGFESETGKGTTFYFDLPEYREGSANSEEPA